MTTSPISLNGGSSTSDSLQQNLGEITSAIADACARVGRDPHEVTLVAVSKTVGLDAVASAIVAGIHDFGENRTAAFNEKHAAFPQERWHFIGSIQTNKVKEFVGKAHLVHSVASERALNSIATRAQGLGITQDVLVEVNVSGEASKDGVALGGLEPLLERATDLEGIRVCGLMTMAPQDDTAAARAAFRGLFALQERLWPHFMGSEHVHLSELSMGMSQDHVIAVEEGATIIRIGRSIWT